MPSTTRRDVLAAASASLATLAGCTTGSDSVSRSVPAPRGEPIDYDAEHVRDRDGAVLFTRSDRTETRTDVHQARHGSQLLTAATERDEYAFASGEAAQRLATFVDATDFERQSVFLFQSGIGACNQMQLQGVTLEANDHPRVAFCRSVRPADVDCAADDLDTVGFAVRLDVAGEDVSGFGTSMRHCPGHNRPPAFAPNVTVEDGDGQ